VGEWVNEESRRRAVSIGLALLPLAGIAFLWFTGVLRDRIGHGEDRVFATVSLASGLLFVAMYFAAGAVAVGLIDTAADARSRGDVGSLWPFGRRVASNLVFTYGLRMAAVFTLSTTTIASRLGLVPRWLAIAGHSTAAVLLFGIGVLPWLDLTFPAWLLMLSIHILVVTFGRDAEPAREPS
jgi:hypothetical protein